MLYGIEQTTDLRYPETVIKKFTSKKSALKWAKNSDDFAWPGATDESLLPIEQNFHRRIRRVYEVKDFKKPSKKEIQKELEHWRHSTYSKREVDVIASAIYDQGERVLEKPV